MKIILKKVRNVKCPLHLWHNTDANLERIQHENDMEIIIFPGITPFFRFILNIIILVKYQNHTSVWRHYSHEIYCIL